MTDRTGLALALAVALGGCDGDGSAGSGPVDAAPPAPDSATQPDGAVPDAALDGALPDVAPPDAFVSADCAPSERAEGQLRVERCRFVRSGAGSVVPRGLVVSGDSLERAARTPLHEPEHYAQIADGDFDLAWLLVVWDGVEPMPGVFNGAYLGRLCEHAGWATDAGLDVVLASSAPGDATLAAWERVLDTCDGVALTGLSVRDAELRPAVEQAARARFGPLLFLPRDDAPLARGAADEIDGFEAAGQPWVADHDGFGTDGRALRDADGEPTDTWRALSRRPTPLSVAGVVWGFGPRAGGWFLSFDADASADGLTRVRVGALGPEPTATLDPDGPFDWFTGYDPVTDEVSLFVEGAPGVVTLELQPATP